MAGHSSPVSRPRPVAPFAIALVLVLAAMIYGGGMLAAALVAIAFLVGYLPWGRRVKDPQLTDGSGAPNSLYQQRIGRDIVDAMSDAEIQQVNQLLQSGHKLGAVKKMRDISGCGLREAKEAVEMLEKHSSDWQ